MSKCEVKRKVLWDVMEVGFHIAGKDQRCPESFPFPACLAAAIRYLGEDYPWQMINEHNMQWKLNMANVEFLCASGMAFGLLWSKDNQCMSCMDLTQVNPGNETIKNAANWARYRIEILEKNTQDSQEAVWREKIVQSINQNVPVLALGVIGPPECSLITGYDDYGETLIGWSYFQDEHTDFEPTGQFRKLNWYPDTWKVIFLKEKTERNLTPKQVLQNALQIMTKKEIGNYYAGFKAYEAWINFLSNSEIENLPDQQLKKQHNLHTILVGNHAESRYWGAAFLENLANSPSSIQEELQECAKNFKDIHNLMWQIWGVLGIENEAAWQKFREPLLREKIIMILEQAKEKDRKVVSILEKIAI